MGHSEDRKFIKSFLGLDIDEIQQREINKENYVWQRDGEIIESTRKTLIGNLSGELRKVKPLHKKLVAFIDGKKEIKEHLANVLSHSSITAILSKDIFNTKDNTNEIFHLLHLTKSIGFKDKELNKIAATWSGQMRSPGLPTYFPGIKKDLFRKWLGTYNTRGQEKENITEYRDQLQEIFGRYKDGPERKILEQIVNSGSTTLDKAKKGCMQSNKGEIGWVEGTLKKLSRMGQLKTKVAKRTMGGSETIYRLSEEKDFSYIKSDKTDGKENTKIEK